MKRLLAAVALTGMVGAALAEDSTSTQRSAYEHDPARQAAGPAGPGQQVTSPAQRAAYEHEVEAHLGNWRHYINLRAQKLQEQGRASEEARHKRLTDAWVSANDAWERLQAAPPAQWDIARARMDAAMQELRAAWRQSTGEDPPPLRE